MKIGHENKENKIDKIYDGAQGKSSHYHTQVTRVCPVSSVMQHLCQEAHPD